MVEETKHETLEFLLARTETAVDHQLADSQTIDGQVVQLFGGGTIIAGFFGLSLSVTDIGPVDAVLCGMGFLAYLVASIFTLRNLTTHLSRGEIEDRLFSSEASQRYKFEIELDLLEDARDIHLQNMESLRQKARERYILIGAVALEFYLFLIAMAFNLAAQADVDLNANIDFATHWEEVAAAIVIALFGFQVLGFIFHNANRKWRRIFISTGIVTVLGGYFMLWLAMNDRIQP